MEIIECPCRKLCDKAEANGLPYEWYLCKKCHKSLLKRRDDFIKNLKNNSEIGSTVNYSGEIVRVY